MQPNCVLTIAGSDSSGGAGIQADIKTISALRCYAASVITALTAQNTQGVVSVFTPNTEFLAQQLNAVLSDLKIDAVKIGMINQVESVYQIKQALLAYKIKNIIIDPVMVAKGGYQLVSDEVMHVIIQELFPLASLITPNIAEAEKITGTIIRNEQEVEQSLAALSQGKYSVLLKGGHLPGINASDYFYDASTQQISSFSTKRIQSNNTHGTGCTLSSAIAAFTAKNHTLPDAIACAKNYLTSALIAAQHYQIGKGCGPVDHFFNRSATVCTMSYSAHID